ncbi:hypothetical protein L7F22_047546 [Adiantum nelumboides]|nr:hypothetical protein [Adiantum nelumboides]
MMGFPHLILYLDDLLIAGNSKDEIAILKDALSKQFAMKDFDDTHHFLGMHIKRNCKSGILELSQEEYIHKVLQHFNMQGGKALSTPMAAYVELSKNDSPKSDAEKAEMENVPYSSAVGSLMYAMVSTRPNITFAVGVVSRYMANPGKTHWEARKHVLRYFKGSASKCLRFENSDASIVDTLIRIMRVVYTRRSTSGYVFLFAGAAVSWRSCLQNCTSSTTTKQIIKFISRAFRYQSLRHRDLDIEPSMFCLFQGTLEDHESLVAAIKQVDVVISTIGFNTLDHLKIIEAIKQAGTIKRFFPSEFGNDVDHNLAYPIPLWFQMALLAIGLQAPPRDKVSIYGSGDVNFITVLEEDVGAYTMKAVDDPRTLNETLHIKPPANIVSMNSLVEMWETLIGITLEKVTVTEEDMVKQIQETHFP